MLEAIAAAMPTRDLNKIEFNSRVLGTNVGQPASSASMMLKHLQRFQTLSMVKNNVEPQVVSLLDRGD